MTSEPMSRPHRRSPWPGLTGLAFGGDYNPEQWPEDIWTDDIVLMKESGVTMATLGVFSWASLEVAEGVYDFDWFDRAIDLVHGAGIALCLATPTASPPPWFSYQYPDSLPVTASGVRLGIGSRESFCPSSADYRAACQRITGELARRYGDHPGLTLWHVNNEYGAHVQACYCETSAQAYRSWLRNRYEHLDALNYAWGTAFWSQRYQEWEHITPPRASPMPVNPAQQLDWKRFSAQQHLECFRAERDLLRAATPDVPITTNFMTTACPNIDYWQWAAEVDVVSNDHYLTGEQTDNQIGLAMSADLTRSLAGGRPWMLMEHSTGAVNWQPRNIAKLPGEMRRNSLSHVARGSDSVMFFQWRASRSGAEKFHSAMLPHGGTSTRKWAEVTALGADIAALAPVQGSTVHADVALMWDWESSWALELEYRPSVDVRFLDLISAYYAAFWRAGVTVDFVAPGADLTPYKLVVLPTLYLATEATAANLTEYVEGGGHLFVSFFSGIVDEHDAVHAGGYPGALRTVLGLWIDELHPLNKDAALSLDDGSVTSVWSEAVVPEAAEVVRRFADGPDAGAPALTRNRLGEGVAWYVATKPDETALASMLASALDQAGVVHSGSGRTEIVRRCGTEAAYVFVINHESHPVTVPIDGTDLLTGDTHDGATTVGPGEVVVLRQPA
jgi:beta-galactosidase